MATQPIATLPEPARATNRWTDLIRQMAACARRMREQFIVHAKDHGLSESEFLALWVGSTSSSEGIAQTELAERLTISPAQASAIVEQLRQAGLMVAHRDPTDRRRQLWQVAPAGRQRIATAGAALAAWAADLDSAFDSAAADHLAEVLERLGAAVATVGRRMATEAEDALTVRRGAA